MKTLTLLLFSLGIFAQDTIPNIERDTLVKISFVLKDGKVDILYEKYKSTISNKKLIEWLLPLLKEIYKKEELEENVIRN